MLRRLPSDTMAGVSVRHPTRASLAVLAIVAAAFVAAPAAAGIAAAVAGTPAFVLTERRAGPLGSAGWANVAALLGTVLALDLFLQGWRDVTSSVAIDLVTSTAELSHLGFHLGVAGGASVLAAGLLAIVLWRPLRAGDRWAYAGIVVGAVIQVALLVVPLRAETTTSPSYGHVHPSVWIIPILWLAVAAATTRSLMLART